MPRSTLNHSELAQSMWTTLVQKLHEVDDLLWHSMGLPKSTYISEMVQSRRFQLFGHVARCDVEQDHARALKAMIGGPPRNWKRPVGRPRQTWLRVVTSDLLPMDLGPNAAWRIAQNRDRWQQDAEMATLR